MSATKTSGEEAVVENPAAPVDQLAAILSAIQDLSGRVAQVEARSPRTVVSRAEREWSRPTNAQQAMEALVAGDMEGFGARTIPTTVNGHEIRGDLLSLMKPRYQPGDVVYLRRDVMQDDESGRTIGDLLDAKGMEGRGEVRRVYWLSRWLQWKYRVHFPGLTPKLGNGYYEDQLESA